jgi:ribosomal protein L7Ae-like RNA K-turn-binding protein
MASAIRRKQQQAALQTFREGQLRKFKLKMRYVCGLKQTIQAVKAGRMKLILLAPNTEASVALDQKIVQLLVLADALSIPVCHCLSRRLLGKALQMPIKQSCVGILSAEGKQDSYELYRKMMNFLRPIDVGK